jgi:hypothetical protein
MRVHKHLTCTVGGQGSCQRPQDLHALQRSHPCSHADCSHHAYPCAVQVVVDGTTPQSIFDTLRARLKEHVENNSVITNVQDGHETP